MSIKLLSYSGIITKVKAIDSKLINLDDYEKISQMESTAEFIAFLKSHPGYSSLFTNYDENDLHRAEIERILNNSVYLEYAKIYRFASQSQRKTLSFLFFRYEINILKSCLQGVFNKETTFDLSTFKTFFEQHSNLKIEQLAAASTMDEFINNLKGSRYYSLFVRLQNTGHKTLYDYEAQLDVFYFTQVWKLKNRELSGSELKFYTNMLGCQIDLLNIIWIYRSKKYYDVDTSKIYASIIPIQYHLKREQLSKMVDAASIDEFANVLKTTYYSKVYGELSHETIEETYQKIILKVYIQTIRKYPISMAPINYYLYRKAVEIDRLTTALECIRYNLEPSQIIKYVLE